MCMQAFPTWLRARLDAQGWTKSDLERASGVHNSIIWRWMSEPPRRPTPANLKKIAPHLGVSYEDLMRMCGYLPGQPEVQNERHPQLTSLLAAIEAGWPAMDESARELAARGARALFAVQPTPRGLSTGHSDGASTSRPGGRRALDGRGRPLGDQGSEGSLPTVHAHRNAPLANALAFFKRWLEPSNSWGRLETAR